MLVRRRQFDLDGYRENQEVALETRPIFLIVSDSTEYARLEPTNWVL
jgi:hypothetical protein